MLAFHEYVTKAKEVAKVRARITFTKAMTLLNMSTGLELFHGRFSFRNGLSSSSLPSMGASSYEPREAISLGGLKEGTNGSYLSQDEGVRRQKGGCRRCLSWLREKRRGRGSEVIRREEL